MHWMKGMMEKRFEIKTKIIGKEPQESQEERILNRIIRVAPYGWEYEADQRHADIIVHELSPQAQGQLVLQVRCSRGPTRAAMRKR